MPWGVAYIGRTLRSIEQDQASIKELEHKQKQDQDQDQDQATGGEMND